MNITALSELQLQYLVRLILSDSSKIWYDINNIPLQIISIGEWNLQAGPDYKDIAVLAEGRLHVGNGEFHRKSSDWLHHGHTNNSNFDNLLLHIIINQDKPVLCSRYTILITPEELQNARDREYRARAELHGAQNSTGEIQSALDLMREHAIRRLNTTIAVSSKLLERQSIAQVFLLLLENFLQKQQSKSRRPGGLPMLAVLRKQPFLERLYEAVGEIRESSTALECITVLNDFLHIPIQQEGAGSRLEMVTNCLLPVICAKTGYNIRSYLLEWYFSLRTINKYAELQRRFPHIPQQFVWQQQGLKQYLAELQPALDREPWSFYLQEPELHYGAVGSFELHIMVGLYEGK